VIKYGDVLCPKCRSEEVKEFDTGCYECTKCKHQWIAADPPGSVDSDAGEG